MREPRTLYDVAKQITLESGLPWTDPRTGETHQPSKKKKKSKKKKRAKK